MKTLALLAALAASLTASAANTLAWWTFDDDPLGVTDATGNCNTLTNGGIAIVDGAASFDGTAKMFSTIRPLPVESTKAYTFECFVRPATTQNSSAGILELSPNAGSYDGGAFIFYPDGAMEHRTVNNKPKWTGRKLQKNILDDQWHHLAAIFTPGGTSNVAEQVLFYVIAGLVTVGILLTAIRLYIRRRIRLLGRPVSPKKLELRISAAGCDLQPVKVRRYLVDAELAKLVANATADAGETDTAKWMTGKGN